MSTPQHTPGPWKVIETHYLAHDGDHVADMSNGLMVVPCFADLGDPLADARLIAAAPNMYEYIASSASNGCAEAARIMGAIHATRGAA